MRLTKAAATAVLALLSACGRPQLADYRDRSPELDLVRFFEGRTYAWGQFQDRFGEVRSAFTVDIDGRWDGDTLTLIEDFLYADGRTERRVWTLRRVGEGRWEGTAPGVVGVAVGEIAGNAFNFRYDFNLRLADGDTVRVTFDDWMWLLDGDAVINRAYVSCFGVQIGEALIFFTKTADPALFPAARLLEETAS